MNDSDMTSETPKQVVQRFVERYISGEQGCHMDYDDAQKFAVALKELLVESARFESRVCEWREDYRSMERMYNLYKAKSSGLIVERDEAVNQLDSARHSVDVLEQRVVSLQTQLATLTAKKGYEK